MNISKTMRKIFDILYWATIDALAAVIAFCAKNLFNFARILNAILPYLMYFIGMWAMKERGRYTIDVELIIPILFIIVIYYLKTCANKIGKGITVPVPTKRFTEVDDDGQVSIEHDRLQELLLYVADLEDWLERKGIL